MLVLIQTSRDILYPVGEMKLTQHFCVLVSGFASPIPYFFATDPEVVESLIGSVPVEHRYKHSRPNFRVIEDLLK